MLTEENPRGELTINNLDLAAYVANIFIFAPLMNPLENITTKVKNMAAEGWSKRYSVGSATAVFPLLSEITWINRHTRTHLYVYWVSGADIK